VLRISNFIVNLLHGSCSLLAQIRNPQFETGNPPEGWKSEGQIRNGQFLSMDQLGHWHQFNTVVGQFGNILFENLEGSFMGMSYANGLPFELGQLN
jgi:hypothetical protein